MTNSNKRRLRDAAAGPGTLISAGCRIEGLVTGSGTFMVDGEVEGEMNIDGSLTLTGSGTCKGIVRADSVIVAGTVDGDIVATGQVEISSTARISGTVSGEAIAVAEGAVVEGVMKTTDKSEPHGFVARREEDDG